MADQETVFVKPADGRLVRDPVSRKPLADDGETKPRNSFWLRRIRCGDCIAQDVKRSAAKPTQPDPKEPKTKKAEAKPEPKKGDDK